MVSDSDVYDGGGELTVYNLTSSDNLTRDNESNDSNTSLHTDIDATLDTTHTETLGAGGQISLSTTTDLNGTVVVTHTPSGQSQTYPANSTNTTTGTSSTPATGATLVGTSGLAGLAFARDFQGIYDETASTDTPQLGMGLINGGPATGSHLGPNGSFDNGLDPFSGTTGETSETITENEYPGDPLGDPLGEDDPVYHSAPDPAEAAHCDCACGEGEGGGVLVTDQTNDAVGMLNDGIVTRSGHTRTLEDVQQYDQDNPAATHDDWDEFFAVGELTDAYRKVLAKELIELRGVRELILKDLKLPGLSQSKLKELDSNRRAVYERIRDIEIELGILGQTALMTMANNGLAGEGPSGTLWETWISVGMVADGHGISQQTVNRMMGTAQAGFGLMEISGAVGVGIAGTPTGPVGWTAAGFLLVHGVDDTLTGGLNAYHGTNDANATNTFLTWATGSSTMATVIEMVATAGASGFLASTTKLASASDDAIKLTDDLAEGARCVDPNAPKSGKNWTDFAEEAARIRDNAARRRGLDPNQNILNMARKADIKAIDRIVKDVGLSKGQREMLHREITKQDYSLDEIKQIAEDIKKYYPHK